MHVLPNARDLKKRFQGFALCDAVLMPEWQMRYFSFDANWDKQNAEMLASVRDGQGMELFVLFSKAGAIGKFYDGKTSLNPKRAIQNIPNRFDDFKSEPAFNLADISNLFWTDDTQSNWCFFGENKAGNDLFGILAAGFDVFRRWAERYYDRPVNKAALFLLYDNFDVSSQVLRRLEYQSSDDKIKQELAIIVG